MKCHSCDKLVSLWIQISAICRRPIQMYSLHDDVIKWKDFPRYWPFVRGEFPHKGQWRGTLIFDLCPNKLLSKQSRGWWFETPSRPLWRHRNGMKIIVFAVTHHCGYDSISFKQLESRYETKFESDWEVDNPSVSFLLAGYFSQGDNVLWPTSYRSYCHVFIDQ